MAIQFFKEDISFDLRTIRKIKKWVEAIIRAEKFIPGEINYIFCSDQYLHQINVDYLQHDTYTDIITFDQSEEEFLIEGDIFISIDRIRENAQNMGLLFEDELKRVMAHGVLHLMGYKDKSPEEQKEMREKEDACLSLQA